MFGTATVAGTAGTAAAASAAGYREEDDIATATVNGETLALKLGVSAPVNADASGGATKELGVAWTTYSEDENSLNMLTVEEVAVRPQDDEDVGISPLRSYVKSTSDEGGYELEYLKWALQAAVSVSSWYLGVPGVPLPVGLVGEQRETLYGDDEWTFETGTALTSEGAAKLAVAFGTESASGATGKDFPLEFSVKARIVEEIDGGDGGLVSGPLPHETNRFVTCTVPFTVSFV